MQKFYVLKINTAITVFGVMFLTKAYIIMQELDPKVMKIFTKEVCSSAKEATQKSGIDKLLPGVVIDDYLFEPCGYSMNGLFKGVIIIYLNFFIYKVLIT